MNSNQQLPVWLRRDPEWQYAQDRLLALARVERRAMLDANPERPQYRAYMQGRYDGAICASAMALGMDPLEFERLVQQ